MASITTKTTPAPTLDITSFSDDEKKALLCLLGSIRMKKGSAITSIIRKLEEFFPDSEFETAFDEFQIVVFSDGVMLDPIYVEIEVNKK